MGHGTRGKATPSIKAFDAIAHDMRGPKQLFAIMGTAANNAGGMKQDVMFIIAIPKQMVAYTRLKMPLSYVRITIG